MDIKKYFNPKLLLAFLMVLGFSIHQALAQVAGAADVVDKNEGLGKMVGFYLLLFLLTCVFIGIIGKVLQVYELTRNIQGKKEGISWDKVNGYIFVIALVAGLYGSYWSYTVQGAQILPDAASEHGEKIDSMFNITLIITTIVFVITHILLFLFAYKYKHSTKKRAYYLAHNNTLEK